VHFYYPSGFNIDGSISNDYGDRVYRRNFETRYPNRIPNFFELVHTLRPEILVKYNYETYSPKLKKGTTY